MEWETIGLLVALVGVVCVSIVVRIVLRKEPGISFLGILAVCACFAVFSVVLSTLVHLFLEFSRVLM